MYVEKSKVRMRSREMQIDIQSGNRKNHGGQSSSPTKMTLYTCKASQFIDITNVHGSMLSIYEKGG